MGLHVFAPRASADLAQRIAVVATGVETTRRVLPDAGVMIGLRYRGDTVAIDAGREQRYPDRAVTGLLACAQVVRTSADGGLMLALLRPDAAARIVRAPVDGLFGATRGLDDVIAPALTRRAIHALYRATSDAERFGVFEQFLRDAAAPRPPDPVVGRALAEIDRTRGTVRIAALRVGRSQDALERRFRAAVGATPKHYASLVRFRRALALCQRGQPLTRVALEAGYADQSHFNRDVRRFTGRAPGALLLGGYC